ncbi:MAG TPA: bifunctional homocysteine S-methyltransferase/methylenetetrahydrofolate reductase [Thermomicrobiales bacterium]|jgi:homocysteine S-methyltransferase|nr:bifunctional homocysteine S-methyltransferase/methylenetetrahydrofolate reductase [Thermomicrobiales bacterium]
MAHPFLDRLARGPLLSDGAMGTMLHAAGTPIDACFDALNLTNPDAISVVHRAYIAAGADVIETNTFGANRFRLEPHGLAGKVVQVNKRAVKLAREEREISGQPVLIAGSIGPTGRSVSHFGRTPVDEVRATFREQAEALLEGGIDLVVIETMSSLDEMDAAVGAVREACDLPLVAMMTFGDDGSTMGGDLPASVYRRLADMGVDVVGGNCSVGPGKLLPVMRALDRVRAEQDGENLPALACQPNAGWPTYIGNRVFYPSSPEYFAGFALDAIAAGVGLIGGCCGTTPEHIAAMRAAIDGHTAKREGETPEVPADSPTPLRIVGIPSPAAAKSTEPDPPTELARKLGEKFVVSVEIDPPKGFNPAKALDGARMLKDAGVDAINVADSPMARVRMSAMTLCYLIQHQVGIETIVHFTTRDRSLMGLQSDLLGAHAVGIRNILALRGDPPSLGDYPDSSAVFDVDSPGLIGVIDRLNRGADSAGASIGRPASFTIACAVDPTKPDLDEETQRLRRKLDAGAHFIMSQPIYDMAVWQRFLDHYERSHGTRDLGVPVLMGILPLQSSKHAEFLHNEVPGITLTDEARDRMRRAGADGRKEGVRMAQDLLLEAEPQVQGVYIMPSFGRYEVAAEVIGVLSKDRELAGAR